jgi:Family of unknown function (DUF5719)
VEGKALVRRIAAIVVIAACGGFAAAAPRPPLPPEPEFTSAAAAPPSATDKGGVWYCPWMNSGADFTTSLMIVSEPAADALISLPSSLPNEPPITQSTDLPAPGSREIDLADIVLNGEAPGFVEFSDGPAGVAATVFGQTSIAGDSCTAFLPKLWHVTGGTTRAGRQTHLRLFNPFLNEAKVTVSGYSELGAEALPELDVVDVPARSWETIDMNEILPFLDELELVVSTEEGSGVIPALVVSTGKDDATWPGTGLSDLWEFPVVRQAGLTPSIVVTNPGAATVHVSVDLFTQSEPLTDFTQVDVEPSVPMRIYVGEGVSGTFGVRLRSDSPVSAVVVAEDIPQADVGAGEEIDPDAPARIAGTIGVQPATGWLLPGAGAILQAEDNSIWLLNTSDNPVTATITPIGLEPHAPNKVSVAAGTLVRVRLDPDVSVASYNVATSTPISAGWSTQSAEAVAFYAGIPIEG